MGITFDVEHIVESSIIKAASGKCIGALTHPSIITRLFQMARVSLTKSEEKCLHIATPHKPKLKKTHLTSQPKDETSDEESEEESAPELEEPDAKEREESSEPPIDPRVMELLGSIMQDTHDEFVQYRAI